MTDTKSSHNGAIMTA